MWWPLICACCPAPLPPPSVHPSTAVPSGLGLPWGHGHDCTALTRGSVHRPWGSCTTAGVGRLCQAGHLQPGGAGVCCPWSLPLSCLRRVRHSSPVHGVCDCSVTPAGRPQCCRGRRCLRCTPRWVYVKRLVVWSMVWSIGHVPCRWHGLCCAKSASSSPLDAASCSLIERQVWLGSVGRGRLVTAPWGPPRT